MPFIEALRASCVEKQIRACKKKYSRASADIDEALASLQNSPLQGVAFPGFGEIHVRKNRYAIKAHKIGKSGGLRLIWLVEEESEEFIIIALYWKGQFKEEKDVLAMIRSNLKKILEEM